MTNDLDAFVAWMKQLQQQLPESVASKVTVSPASDNRSAYIDLECSDGTTGRLILHEFGGANADLVDGGAKHIDLTQAVINVGGWEDLSADNFDTAFEPFIRYFLKPGSVH